MKRHTWYCLLLGLAGLSVVAGSVQAAPERRWDLRLESFFGRGTIPLSVYCRARDGKWISPVVSSVKPGSQSPRPTFTKSYHYVDLSRTPIVNGKFAGPATVYMNCDCWMPPKHRGFTVDIEIDAIVTDDAIDGSWKMVKVNTDDPSAEQLATGGKLTGKAKDYTPVPLPDPVTFNMKMGGALVGGSPDFGERHIVLQLGFRGGKLASAIWGRLSQKELVYGRTSIPLADVNATADGDQISGRAVIHTRSLDDVPCTYAIDFGGGPMEGFNTGWYKLTADVEGAASLARVGGWDGKWNPGIEFLEGEGRPWWTPVKTFKPVQPGEHPRLLFRKSDLPALRKKAETPEGKAIMASLRRSLNGGDGETLPHLYSSSTKAYENKGVKADDGKPAGADKAGVYTISHVAGYGFLYQITGDKKYAELGRQCFEKALEGQRDRDDRYSWKTPGGALRAGPVLGWYALGYDLCYDGWDEATREKFGKAIAQYNEGREHGDAGANLDLGTLVRGSMPPGSNHFGMQVGGAAMALLAVMNDPGVDQKRIETLLRVSEQSMMRNLTEGFGDGGFFVEGDGCGSMSSQIAFLSALQSWRTAMGRDYANTERPNARMTALKWIYLTVVRGGHPDFWPIRGAYGQNVWAGGLSGGGYFGIGLGAVTEEQKAAMKWYYNHFLLKADEKAGGPYDTVSPYPHHSACAFVNWPIEMQQRNPAEVLPLCYRDSVCDFYAWRNRWQDENDIVISVLTKVTQGGNYHSAPDGGLQVAAFGQKFKWGQVSGQVKYWWTSPRGEASVLTTADGISTAVDFTKASGADAMLVTTGQAEGERVKVGDQTLTIKFLTQGALPAVAVHGEKVVVGKQEIALKDGNLTLAVSGTGLSMATNASAQRTPQVSCRQTDWPGPNEHPRLFFTKDDVPDLRRRAETPEGKRIVANLHDLLKKQVPLEQSQGGETRHAGLWAAGQAFAYTLSGKQIDADAAMKRTQAIVDAPVINMPELRRGTRYMGVAIAYDLCYDAWPKEFREKVAAYLAARADGLLTRNEGVKGDNPAAQSNHNVEGRTQMGVIALAILGDTGAGDAMPAIVAARKDLDDWLRVGIGGGGFGTEGEAFTLNCLNWGVFQFAAAHAQVLGEPATRNKSLDHILPLVMMRIINQDLPYHGPKVSKWDGCDVYGSAFWAMGAALSTEQLRPAFRTFYDAQFGLKSRNPFKIQHPAEAIFLLRYYPSGVEGKPLEDVLPKTAQDMQKGFFVFRNTYKDATDCLATVYLHREAVRASWQCEPSIHIWGLGGKWLSFDPSRKTVGTRGQGAEPVHAALLKGGSGAVTAKADTGAFAFAVDYSGAADVPAAYVLVDDSEKPLTMVANAKITIAADGRSFTLSNDAATATLHATLLAPAGAKCTADKNILTLPGKSRLVMTLQAGDVPAVAAEGDAFKIGKQVIRWQDEKLEIGAK